MNWLFIASALLAVGSAAFLGAGFATGRLRGRASAIACCAPTCCVIILATAVALIAILWPSAPLPTHVGVISPFASPEGVGIAFSGGSLSGMLDAECYLGALDALANGQLTNPIAGSRELAVASVSGGTLGYLSFRALELLFPPSASNWTLAELVAWPATPVPDGRTPFNQVSLVVSSLAILASDLGACISGNLLACAKLVSTTAEDASANDALQQSSHAPYAGSVPSRSQLLQTLRGIPGCLARERYWFCILEVLAVLQGIEDPHHTPTGPLTWWVQWSQFNPIAAPIGGGQAALPIPAFSDVVGGIGVLELRASKEASLIRTRQMVPNGMRTRGGLLERTGNVSQFAAFAYSTDFLSMGAAFADPEGKWCPAGPVNAAFSELLPKELECARAELEGQPCSEPWAIESQQVLGEWPADEASPGAAATDGGALEMTGLATLLRANAPHAIVFFENDVPFGARCLAFRAPLHHVIRHGALQAEHANTCARRDAPTARSTTAVEPKMSWLFGVPCCAAQGSQQPEPVDLCKNQAPAAGVQELQVFESSLWPAVHSTLADPTGPGSVLLRNVTVRPNALYGVKHSYTLKTLLIFSNMRATGWEATMQHWDEIAPSLGLPAATFPAVSGFVTPANATAKCLLAQWKVAQRNGLIKELFGVKP